MHKKLIKWQKSETNYIRIWLTKQCTSQKRYGKWVSFSVQLRHFWAILWRSKNVHIMNDTMPSNHHILIHIMSNSPETNSTKSVDEKRGRVAWPVEEIKQKEAKTNIITYASFGSHVAHIPLYTQNLAGYKIRFINTR